MILEPLIEQVRAGQDLTIAQMETAIGEMLAGRVGDEGMSQLLLALRDKGEAVTELVGAARAMRRTMTAITTRQTDLLDTCGTGGDGSKTFNISTAAALVAAAAGAHIAKHGNRKITSATGSADVLTELGIRIDAPRVIVERCLDQLGIGFCFAPLLHPAMKHVGQVRRSLGVPTLFNYLGPLCNPANADFQLLGVGRQDLQEKIAAAIAQLPVRAALVVRGLDGMDEVSLSSPTRVFHVRGAQLEEWFWTPESFGLGRIDPRGLLVETPQQSAAVIRGVLSGQPGPARDIVLANAAAGVWLVGLAPDLPAAVRRCASAIDSGQATRILGELAQLSQCLSDEELPLEGSPPTTSPSTL
jgi:anthranilate phosphoribosyltransferase